MRGSRLLPREKPASDRSIQGRFGAALEWRLWPCRVSITDFKAGGRLVSTLAEVKGLAHAWSGGTGTAPNNDPLGADASRMAWGFAAKQFSA